MSTEDRRAAHRPGGVGGTDHVEDGGERDYWDRAAYTAGAHTEAPYASADDDARTEQAEHGGTKVGVAFLGWLTAIGTAVVLTSVLALAATAFGITTGTTLEDATARVREDPGAGAVASAVVVAVVLGVSFWCGGYAAGRMARFDGTRQGLAVWLWALLVTLLTAGLAAVAGEEYDVLAALDGVPRLPALGDGLTQGLVAGAAVAGISLAASLLGGRAGMRYHRMVDRSRVGY